MKSFRRFLYFTHFLSVLCSAGLSVFGGCLRYRETREARKWAPRVVAVGQRTWLHLYENYSSSTYTTQFVETHWNRQVEFKKKNKQTKTKSNNLKQQSNWIIPHLLRDVAGTCGLSTNIYVSGIGTTCAFWWNNNRCVWCHHNVAYYNTRIDSRILWYRKPGKWVRIGKLKQSIYSLYR